jgi:hypothetical protein
MAEDGVLLERVFERVADYVGLAMVKKLQGTDLNLCLSN